jgi:ABC-2 type transport system ATP-binding protein
VIEVKHLTKVYGNHTAVEDLSFTVEDGRIYGLLGPNGAGKTTTMNIMTGCLGATGGEVLIDGLDIFDEPEKAKRKIGYLPELPPLYPDLTPREYLEFVAKARGVNGSERAAQIEKVMEITQIEEMQDRLIKNLSKGYRQRVGIAQSLLGDPEVVILDEPTVGLDPSRSSRSATSSRAWARTTPSF